MSRFQITLNTLSNSTISNNKSFIVTLDENFHQIIAYIKSLPNRVSASILNQFRLITTASATIIKNVPVYFNIFLKLTISATLYKSSSIITNFFLIMDVKGTLIKYAYPTKNKLSLATTVMVTLRKASSIITNFSLITYIKGALIKYAYPTKSKLRLSTTASAITIRKARLGDLNGKTLGDFNNKTLFDLIYKIEE